LELYPKGKIIVVVLRQAWPDERVDTFDRFLADPELSQVEIVPKRVAFNWTLGPVFSIIILAILRFILDADILVHFGVVLIIFYAIEIKFLRKHNFDF
jgi:hypothetical protein